MASISRPVRTDIPYLRRRIKPGPPAQPEAAATAVAPEPARTAAPVSSGLDLSAPSAPPAASPSATPSATATRPAPPRVVIPAHALPFHAPGIADVRELGDEDPVLRLNALESALGSLVVTGVTGIAWEDSTLVTGAAHVDGGELGTPVSTPGHRPLVGWDERDALVSLRHIASLRRALFIGRGPETIGVQIFDGEGFTLAMGDVSQMYVLYLLRVGNLVELRAEAVSRTAPDEVIYRDFGFSMTPRFTARDQRSR